LPPRIHSQPQSVRQDGSRKNAQQRERDAAINIAD